MAYKSLAEGVEIENPKTDRKNAICIDRYHIGEKAVYLDHFPSDYYIPYKAVGKVWYQASQYNTIGACGKGIPVFVVCVMYDDGTDAGKLQKYILEKESDAKKMAELIQYRCEELRNSSD